MFLVDYLNKIDNGLIIEKPKMVLPWILRKKDVISKINGIRIVNENYYTLKVTLSGISFINCMGLHFENERLSDIDLFNNDKIRIESEINNIFNAHQLILEDFFGIPNRNKLLDFFKGYNKEYIWKFKYVTIKHRLWNRFGMEEVLKIHIND